MELTLTLTLTLTDTTSNVPMTDDCPLIDVNDVTGVKWLKKHHDVNL